ncbi:MAG: hypothetical protein AB3N24_23205, partial [Leisingera sp.]
EASTLHQRSIKGAGAMPSWSDLYWFISKPRAVKRLLFLLCIILTTELVLIYYVLYEPDMYLDSRARFFAPWLVWVFPPVVTFMLLRLIKVDADALRRGEREESFTSSGEG